MARLSGATVLLILLAAVSMYTCGFHGGTALSRALERKTDNVTVSISIRGVVEYFTKELWDVKEGGRHVGDEAVHRDTGDRVFVMTKPRMQAGRRHSPGAANQGLVVARPSPRHRSNFSREITNARVELSLPVITNYTNLETSERPIGLSVVKVGPWGGSGGQPFYMRGSSVPRLRSITLYHSGSAIHSLSCDYYSQHQDEDDDGAKPLAAGPWGRPHSFGSTAVRATINLSADEHLTAIEGTTGHFGRLPDLVITSLTFRTSNGETYGPYGEKRGTRRGFSIPAENGCIIGFWGRSGWLLDAIGVYIRPCRRPTPPVYKLLH